MLVANVTPKHTGASFASVRQPKAALVLRLVIEAKAVMKFGRKLHLALAPKKAGFGTQPKPGETTTKLRVAQNPQMASNESAAQHDDMNFPTATGSGTFYQDCHV